jgi:hypothetical protein
MRCRATSSDQGVCFEVLSLGRSSAMDSLAFRAVARLAGINGPNSLL